MLPITSMRFSRLAAPALGALSLGLCVAAQEDAHPRTVRAIWPCEDMEIKTVGGKFPGQHVKAKAGAMDLSGAQELVTILSNRTETAATVQLCVQNGSPQGCTPNGSITLPPHGTGVIVCDLTPEPWALDKPLELVGMKGRPMAEGEKSNFYSLKRVSSIDYWRFEGDDPTVFEIVSVSLEGRERPRKVFEADSFLPFVDEYGQFRHLEWPGKVHSDEELRRRGQEEEDWLASASAPFPDIDEYGGWAKGPKREATGFFRVEKIDGRWWFVDPLGNLFWSSGINNINATGSDLTGVTKRENYFSWLPAKDDPQFGVFWSVWPWKTGGGFYSREENIPYDCIDFPGVNLARKYGNDWRGKYRELAHRRLRAWGVNTIGNWSATDIEKMRRTPYTLFIHTRGTPRRKGSDGQMTRLPDGEAPEFEAKLRERVRKAAEWMKDDPWCLGVFVDNEHPWSKSPEAGEIADLYYRTVKRVLREELPNHLYLGDRIGWAFQEVYRVASRHCDVVSLNIYSRAPDHDLPEGSEDKPMLVGEFHFGAFDRGMLHTGLVAARDQEERARCYLEYMRQSASRPRIVGAHWFQWRDEPLAGRFDGENFQCGFVDVADTPYPELVEAARQFAREVYPLRRGCSMP